MSLFIAHCLWTYLLKIKAFDLYDRLKKKSFDELAFKNLFEPGKIDASRVKNN